MPTSVRVVESFPWETDTVTGYLDPPAYQKLAPL
jgi:hypothetical protein